MALAVEQESSASVRWCIRHHCSLSESCLLSVEPCTENNGGCEANAVCSSDDKTAAVTCTCKEGYLTRGTGSGTGVKCISELRINKVFIAY